MCNIVYVGIKQSIEAINATTVVPVGCTAKPDFNPLQPSSIIWVD